MATKTGRDESGLTVALRSMSPLVKVVVCPLSSPLPALTL